MGCTGSKQARRDRRRRSSSPPPYVKSSPLLSVDSRRRGGYAAELSFSDEEEMMKSINVDLQLVQQRRTSMKNDVDVQPRPEVEAPTTSSLAPPDIEPEIINAWDLMEGLEDADDNADDHTFSYSSSPELLEEDLIIADFNAYIMSSIGIALEDLPPANPLSCGRSPAPMETGIVQARIEGFQHKMNDKRASTDWVAPRCKFPPGGKKKVVLYFTSLRGVRKTYEDCRTAEAILKGYGVRVDERDVSMDGGFRDELEDLLGGGNRLPAVFVDGHYLGGIEEVRQFHEAGELGKALEGCEARRQLKKGEGAPCEGCGDARFLVCPTCSGSCKLCMEDDDEEDGDDDDEEDDEEEELLDGFRRCLDCNENGLIRCPFCCCC